MADIATIHGGRMPGSPSAEILDDLEMLMARAKAGTLIGFAYATCNEDGSQATGWSGEAGSRHPLGTAVMMLQHRYASAMVEGRMDQ
jgi:hypothetical protein